MAAANTFAGCGATTREILLDPESVSDRAYQSLARIAAALCVDIHDQLEQEALERFPGPTQAGGPHGDRRDPVVGFPSGCGGGDGRVGSDRGSSAGGVLDMAFCRKVAPAEWLIIGIPIQSVSVSPIYRRAPGRGVRSRGRRPRRPDRRLRGLTTTTPQLRTCRAGGVVVFRSPVIP